MEKKKLVKRDYFTALLSHVNETGFATENISAAEFEKFLTNELDLLAKKNATERKPTAKDIADDALRAELLNTLRNAGKAISIADIIKQTPAFDGLTPQKISGIMRNMIGVSIKRIEDKRKPLFTLI